jgi:type I restriction enzyme S subunit
MENIIDLGLLLSNLEGVEYVELGKVCKISKGVQLNKNELSETGQYPAYNGGKTFSGWTNSYNVNENTVIISQGGASAGFVNYVDRKFWANAHCYYLLPFEEILDNRFMFHLLKLNEKYFMTSQHGAGIPALATEKLRQFQIPVPPLEVQQEIVKILDRFSKLEAELEAELEARKKQYEYYRNKLLTFKKLENE